MKPVLAIIVSGILLFVMGIPTISAQTQLQNVYVDSDVPTQIPWNLTSVNLPYTDQFYCDKSSKTTFNLGKTTVRCMETKPDETIRSSFIVTVGYKVVQIPDWFKTPTKFWIENAISDAEYFNAVSEMIKNEYLYIPHEKSQKTSKEIPVWIYDNSDRWIKNMITDDEFSIGLQWLIQNGLIEIKT
ncbi:MAG: plastocyanin [Nitrosarchaeum sp.]|nr:plastocyanin [Nitrosarchaeum sp.]MCV0398421.1 plastocyanin [Nitrosarchaeum sp.]